MQDIEITVANDRHLGLWRATACDMAAVGLTEREAVGLTEREAIGALRRLLHGQYPRADVDEEMWRWLVRQPSSPAALNAR